MAVVSRGFTLLELLVTISIIGILMAVVSVSFSTAQKKGRDARREGDITAIQKSLEQCYSIDGKYLATISSGSPLTCFAGQKAMNQVPYDPKNSDPYLYDDYYTIDDNPATKYCLCAVLENTGKGNASTTGGSGDCAFVNNGDYFCVSSQQ